MRWSIPQRPRRAGMAEDVVVTAAPVSAPTAPAKAKVPKVKKPRKPKQEK